MDRFSQKPFFRGGAVFQRIAAHNQIDWIKIWSPQLSRKELLQLVASSPSS
jgi:hypothetical protein